MIGFLFVAKDSLGLVLNQLNVIHFRAPGRLTDVRLVSAGGRRRCWSLGAIFTKHFGATFDDQYWFNHVAIADEHIEREPTQLVGRAVKSSMVCAVLSKAVGNENSKNGDRQPG
ncbi:hypothetical protein [Pseudomonas sp. C2B4]|uniref:hypothetical protein n=1 Tax=Pseudomonas sp. C2B4 TaxID=2735270 RepID=UPI001585DA17|nr:hypothetical protein [Pseudomonas sp. C2B4]NUU37805.1 hypothetical protein [Pseudomonas sp. C2B4]